MPPIDAAASVFNKLTLRLKDRPIAASANTSVLPKAGKPYALRFHRSSSSTAACSMRRSTVQRSARHCRAYAQRPRPDSRPAYLHAMYADMYQYQCLHLTTLASHRQHTMPAGLRLHGRVSAAIVALQLRSDLMHVRQTCMGTWVRSAAGLVSPRTRGCAVLVGLISGG